MYKFNLKIALRNLVKNKVYAAINIGGLATGLTAFILLLLFINHEVSYDKWSPSLANVYQVREYHDFFTPDNKQYWQERTESRLGALLAAKVPQFKYVTKVEGGINYTDAVKLENSDPVMVKGLLDADSLFFKVFPYTFIQGDAITAISKPNTIVLKESLALKLFGTTKVLGKHLKTLAWRGDEGSTLTVTGVVADPDTPESLNFTAISHTGQREKDPEQIGSSNYCNIYALAENELDTNAINKTLQKVYVDFKKSIFAKREVGFDDYYKDGKKPGLKVIPLRSVYSTPAFSGNWLEKIKPLIALSIFLLLVSIINFVNLSTAQSVQRAKEVGVKKVLGVFKKQLILQFLLESAIQSLAALFVSIILVEMLLPSFNHHFDIELSFWHSTQLVGMLFQLFAVLIVITLLAGFYPAWVLSKYNPVKVLKGDYETGFKGIALRNGLVIFQFIIAVTFITGLGVMHAQTSYIANKDLGFSRDRLVNIATNYTKDDPFVTRIRRIPGVKYVATTTQVLGNTFNVPSEIKYNNQQYQVNSVTVTMETLPALGVKVASGRIFSPEYKQDSINSAVMNQSAANLLGKNVVGKIFHSGMDNDAFQIIGVIKDYHNEGFDKAVLPTIYKVTHLGGSSNTNNLLVRFDTDHYGAAMKAIAAEWKKLYPDFPMQYSTVEAAFQNELASTQRLMRIVELFSIISVVVSLLGLFALSAFMAKRRTKEVAIRKILGASDFQIINLLNRSFLILVISANMISWPVAFIFTRKWLEGFAYRIEMPIWPFVLATLSSIVISLFTVSLQARKAAITNPVDSLKYE